MGGRGAGNAGGTLLGVVGGARLLVLSCWVGGGGENGLKACLRKASRLAEIGGTEEVEGVVEAEAVGGAKAGGVVGTKGAAGTVGGAVG